MQFLKEEVTIMFSIKCTNICKDHNTMKESSEFRHKTLILVQKNDYIFKVNEQY